MSISSRSSSGAYYVNLSDSRLTGKTILGVSIASWAGLPGVVAPFFDKTTNVIGLIAGASMTISRISLRVYWKD